MALFNAAKESKQALARDTSRMKYGGLGPGASEQQAELGKQQGAIFQQNEANRLALNRSLGAGAGANPAAVQAMQAGAQATAAGAGQAVGSVRDWATQMKMKEAAAIRGALERQQDRRRENIQFGIKTATGLVAPGMDIAGKVGDYLAGRGVQGGAAVAPAALPGAPEGKPPAMTDEEWSAYNYRAPEDRLSRY